MKNVRGAPPQDYDAAKGWTPSHKHICMLFSGTERCLPILFYLGVRPDDFKTVRTKVLLSLLEHPGIQSNQNGTQYHTTSSSLFLNLAIALCIGDLEHTVVCLSSCLFHIRHAFPEFARIGGRLFHSRLQPHTLLYGVMAKECLSAIFCRVC